MIKLTPKIVEIFEVYFSENYPVAEVSLTLLNRGVVTVNKIIVDKPYRKRGIGTQIMTELIQFADYFSFTITLTTSTQWGGTSRNRLRKFYKRFGFIRNKGRNKDFTISDGMYRKPRGG